MTIYNLCIISISLVCSIEESSGHQNPRMQKVVCQRSTGLCTRANAFPDKGGPNKRGGWADFFIYYMKNSGQGGIFSRLLHKKQGEEVKISKIK